MSAKGRNYPILIAIISAIFFIPFLGGVHLFDWDEINFAEISREMLITKDYLRIYVNFDPFWEKPPFFFWVQSLSMKVFGVNEFAARFPNAICGIITLIILFLIGKRLHNTQFGLVWVGAYFGSILPHLYFRSGIIDPYFNLFIFIGLYYFILFYWKKENFGGIKLTQNKWTYLFIGGFIIGMGILTKGPVAFLIAGLCLFVYWVYKRFRFYVNISQFLFFTLAASIVTLTWYGLETLKNGPWFIIEFNKYQYRLFSTPDAGHKGFFGYHFIVLLIGCFPASIFLIRSFFKMPASEFEFQQDFKRWMKILFWVVLILFSIVQSKIVHYSSMCYFPLTYLAAVSINQILEDKISFNKWMKFGLYFIGGLYVLAILTLPFLAMNPSILKTVFTDSFAIAALDAKVDWIGLEILPGIFLLVILILSIYQITNQKKQKGFRTLFLGTAIFIPLTLFFFAGNIESYSQRTAIEFYKSKASEDCYVRTYGFKSYGQLFYTQKTPNSHEKNKDWIWLVDGPIDKNLYVVAKLKSIKDLSQVLNLKEIDRKNGFVFYKRDKVSQ